MSATKRPLAADDIDDVNDNTSIIAKIARTGAAAAVSTSESRESVAQTIALALRVGVFPFLSLRDAAVLLSSCKAFWQDAELAALALQIEPAREIVRHLGTKCIHDWFSPTPRRTALGYDGDLKWCELSKSYTSDDDDDDQADIGEEVAPDSEEEGQTEAKWTDMPNAFAKPVLDARLVSAIAAVTESILPLSPGRECYVRWVGVESYQIFVVPVMIPLRSYHPNAANLPVFHDWSREDVRVALNTLRGGFGDRFVDDDPANAFASQFGLHWDNVHLSTESGKMECAFCSVAKYVDRYDTAKVMDEHNARTGVAATSLLDELRESELGQKFASCELVLQAAYDDDDDEEGEEDEKYCQALGVGGATVFPRSEVKNSGFQVSDVRNARDADSEYPELCSNLAQPLKQFLLQSCTFTTRMKYEWECDNDACDGDMHSDVDIELLTGVLPSGYLCGSFCVRNMDI